MSMEHQKRWCLFTSAGDKNAVRRWLEDGAARRWDLIVAYYGDDEQEFSVLTEASRYAFRTKGGKFQNLKELVALHPSFFDQYSYVWVCDDDIRMSGAEIDDSFSIAECFQFWIAQPAFRPQGKISHWITCYAGPHCDYRVVNFVEVAAPIFCRAKLLAFLTAYDGSLTGYGIDYWYMNFFKANEFGRFAVIDKIQVTNPLDADKGGSEIDRLQPAPQRRAAWADAKRKHGIVEFPQKVFAYCKISSDHKKDGGIERPMYEFPPELQSILTWMETHRPIGWRDGSSYLRSLGDDAAWRIAVHLARGLSSIKEPRCNIIHRAHPPYIVMVQYLEQYSPVQDELFRDITAMARSLKIEFVPTFGVSYSDAGLVKDVRFERFRAPG